MKIAQTLRLGLRPIATLMLCGVFTFQAYASEIIGISPEELETLLTAAMEGVQTSTATLDRTSWKVKILSTSSMMGGLQASTAVLTFGMGQITISDWIYNLDSAPYYEYPAGEIISFTATLTKQGTFPPQIFQIAGTATDDEKIVGLLYNLNSGMMIKRSYVFWGEQLSTTLAP